MVTVLPTLKPCAEVVVMVAALGAQAVAMDAVLLTASLPAAAQPPGSTATA